MGSRQMRDVNMPERRRVKSRRRLCRRRKSSTTAVNGGARAACSSVSDKLEALKSLIPAQNGDVNADELFKETADYIVLLRTQISILQRLVDLYESSERESVIVQQLHHQ